MSDRLHSFRAGAATIPEYPDIHPNIADIYRRKVARLAEALNNPKDHDAAASAIRGLIERLVLTPSETWAEMDAVLHGDFGAILKWVGNGSENTKTDIPVPEMSVSMVAGAGFAQAPTISRAV